MCSGSKELSDEDKADLLKLQNAASDAVTEDVWSDGEEGVTVEPLPPPRRPSFRNGRRVSEPTAPSPMRVQVASSTPSAAKMPDGRGDPVPTKKGTHGSATDPESPTSVAVSSFFGDMLSGSNLLAGL